jgi:hypothetical protein
MVVDCDCYWCFCCGRRQRQVQTIGVFFFVRCACDSKKLIRIRIPRCHSQSEFMDVEHNPSLTLSHTYRSSDHNFPPCRRKKLNRTTRILESSITLRRTTRRKTVQSMLHTIAREHVPIYCTLDGPRNSIWP